MNVSGSGGDCRFAVPPNPGTVRIRVGFTDCGGESGTAGTARSATSQPPVLISSIVFGLPELVLPWGVWQISTDSELLCVGFKQSGTASVHCKNRPFTQLVPIPVSLLGADRSPSSDWQESLRSQPDSSLYGGVPVTFSDGLSLSAWLLQRRLTLSCRIHPAAEPAGILLDFYKSLCQIRFSAPLRRYEQTETTTGRISCGVRFWSRPR